MKTLLLTTDLMGSSKFSGDAQACGVELQVISSAGQFMDVIQAGDVRLIVVDLASAGFDPNGIIQACRENDSNAKIIGYGPHVHETKLQQARDAGFDQVLTRGQFMSQSVEILKSVSD